jgi:hypothetical protein
MLANVREGSAMHPSAAKTVALDIAALSLAPSFAHALEAYPRLAIWTPELWREATVFNAQFRLFAAIGAPVDILAILAPAVLAYSLRGARPNFMLALAGTIGFALGLLLWFSIVAPANAVLATWTHGPIAPDFAAVRLRWESGHLVIAAVKLASFTLVALACVWTERRAQPR